MHDNNLLELFITFAGSMDEHHNAEWNMTVLEIFYHIFAPYAPSDILEQPEAEENMLLKSLLQQEQRSTQFKSSRHGRFGGSILIKSGVFTWHHGS